MPFTKAFQKQKHDAASQLLKEYANSGVIVDHMRRLHGAKGQIAPWGQNVVGAMPQVARTGQELC